MTAHYSKDDLLALAARHDLALCLDQADPGFHLSNEDMVMISFALKTAVKHEESYRHAVRLLNAIWPEGTPLHTVIGVIDQIDNWIVGHSHNGQTAQRSKE